MINLYSVEKNDLAVVWGLNQAALPHVNSITSGDIERYSEIAAYFKVARAADGKVCGFLIAHTPGVAYESANYLWFQKTYDNFVYIDRVVVDEQARGLGVGRALYEDVIGFSKACSPRLTCEVNAEPPNPVSDAFHKGFGFLPVGSQSTEGGAKTVSLLSLDF